MTSNNFADLPNPYDYANPVRDPGLFAGRSQELQEVRYYLDQATRTARPINLAIIGDRASGKTSLLNMIEHEACQRGLCTVRVDLDEGDAESQLAFFGKLFDALLTSAVTDCGAFGGPTSKTYDVYRDMVDGYEVPGEKLFCPFLFPIHYAKAMGAGNRLIVASDAALKHDLAAISHEVGRPIILLMDECDVLSKSRVHLEKLRNVFMNTPGFMLVLTGTPLLFPVMNEVFSPIIRQFKRIALGPFQSQEDTEQCIRGPLKMIGISPSQIFDLETYTDVSEIHDLSSGRPYEIQLICHVLFRRVQLGKTDRMSLTVDVLDEVLTELQQTQDVYSRPVITAVRSLDMHHLDALSLLSLAPGGTAFGSAWFHYYLLHGDDEWSADELRTCLEYLKSAGIVTTKDDLVVFAGDDFDRVYCKYLARKHGVPLQIWGLPWEVRLALDLDQYMGERQIQPLRLGQSMSAFVRAQPATEDLAEVGATLNAVVSLDDPFMETPALAQEVYWNSVTFGATGRFCVTILTISTPWGSISRTYRSACVDQPGCQGTDGMEREVEPLRERAASLGASIQTDTLVLHTVPLEDLETKLVRSANSALRQRIGDEHDDRVREVYSEEHDLEKAVFHARLAHKYLNNAGSANNLGYLMLGSGDYASAKEFLKQAIASGDASQQALSSYNLAVVYALEGNLKECSLVLDVAVGLAERLPDENRGMLCLYVLQKTSEGFHPVEESGPDLLETVLRMRTLIALERHC